MSFAAPLATEETYQERHKICDSCEYKKRIVGMEQCSKCGCLLSVKLRLKNTYCPIEKWNKED